MFLICALTSARAPCALGSSLRGPARRHLHDSAIGRLIIASDKVQSWAYTEEFSTEPETVRDARDRAEEMGIEAVSGGSLIVVIPTVQQHA